MRISTSCWRPHFGGSAWEWDEQTEQYYYHAYLHQQPDLNWRNPAVRADMYDVLRFWLERGVDGFRVDVLWHLIKDDQFRDNPPNPDWAPGMPTIYYGDEIGMNNVQILRSQVMDPFERNVPGQGFGRGGVASAMARPGRAIHAQRPGRRTGAIAAAPARERGNPGCRAITGGECQNGPRRNPRLNVLGPKLFNPVNS